MEKLSEEQLRKKTLVANLRLIEEKRERVKEDIRNKRLLNQLMERKIKLFDDTMNRQPYNNYASSHPYMSPNPHRYTMSPRSEVNFGRFSPNLNLRSSLPHEKEKSPEPKETSVTTNNQLPPKPTPPPHTTTTTEVREQTHPPLSLSPEVAQTPVTPIENLLPKTNPPPILKTPLQSAPKMDSDCSMSPPRDEPVSNDKHTWSDDDNDQRSRSGVNYLITSDKPLVAYPSSDEQSE